MKRQNGSVRVALIGSQVTNTRKELQKTSIERHVKLLNSHISELEHDIRSLEDELADSSDSHHGQVKQMKVNRFPIFYRTNLSSLQ